jgi:hypothetical protein
VKSKCWNNCCGRVFAYWYHVIKVLVNVLLRYTPVCTVRTEALLGTELGKQRGRYDEQPAIHLRGLGTVKLYLLATLPSG